MEKNTTTSCFDVTIDSYDITEVYELVGIFILSKPGNIIDKKNTGCDEELILLWNVNPQGTDKMRKIIITVQSGWTSL